MAEKNAHWRKTTITQSLTPRCMERGRRGLDRVVVGFTSTYAISAYHH